MKKDQIKIGSVYLAKVSGKLVQVRINSEETYHRFGDKTRTGWYGTNITTGRSVKILSAARLRNECMQVS